MTINRIPCTQCICRGICKYKTYTILIGDCKSIEKMLYTNFQVPGSKKILLNGMRTQCFNSTILRVEDVLKPPLWSVSLKIILYGGADFVIPKTRFNRRIFWSVMNQEKEKSNHLGPVKKIWAVINFNVKRDT